MTYYHTLYYHKEQSLWIQFIIYNSPMCNISQLWCGFEAHFQIAKCIAVIYESLFTFTLKSIYIWEKSYIFLDGHIFALAGCDLRASERKYFDKQ